MSKKTEKTEKSARLRVVIPGANLDEVLGSRDEGYMNESMTEPKSKLDKKREELAGLELDSEMLDIEDKIKRRRGGEPVSEPPKKDLGDRLVEQVVIPLVNRKLAEEDKGGASGDVVDRALRIAERAVGQRPAEGKEKSALDELDKGVAIFTKIRGLIEGEKDEKEDTGEKPKEETDYLTQLDKGINLVKKIRDTFPQEGGGGGTDQALIEFKKWEKQFEANERKAHREYQLAERKIDKGHDIELAKLGIEKERNDLLRDGFKKVGHAVATALGEDEDESEEEEEPAPAVKGRQQLIKAKCTICGAEILIPPESQVVGKEFKCSKCSSIFKWERDVSS
jgi:DNA-directed RNA polymerase subunit RPC12/RpoP